MLFGKKEKELKSKINALEKAIERLKEDVAALQTSKRDDEMNYSLIDEWLNGKKDGGNE